MSVVEVNPIGAFGKGGDEVVPQFRGAANLVSGTPGSGTPRSSPFGTPGSGTPRSSPFGTLSFGTPASGTPSFGTGPSNSNVSFVRTVHE